VRDPSQSFVGYPDHVVVTRPWHRSRQLRQRFPQLQRSPSDDICYATQNRQTRGTLYGFGMRSRIGVGSTEFFNSNQLVRVARQAGARAGYLIDYVDQIAEIG